MTSSTSTLQNLILSTDSVAAKEHLPVAAAVPRVRARRRTAANTKIINAVYAYIRAMRTLGHVRLNTAEVAMALSVPTGEVNRAVTALRKKGVKVNG